MGPFLEVDLDDMSIVGRLKHRKTFEVTDRYHNDTIEAMCTVDQEILDHPLTKDKVIERTDRSETPLGPRWLQMVQRHAQEKTL
jgi:hypothetical protein